MSLCKLNSEITVHQLLCCFVSLLKGGWKSLKQPEYLERNPKQENYFQCCQMSQKEKTRPGCPVSNAFEQRAEVWLALLPPTAEPAALQRPDVLYQDCTRNSLHLRNEALIYYLRHLLSFCLGVPTMITSQIFFICSPPPPPLHTAIQQWFVKFTLLNYISPFWITAESLGCLKQIWLILWSRNWKSTKCLDKPGPRHNHAEWKLCGCTPVLLFSSKGEWVMLESFLP